MVEHKVGGKDKSHNQCYWNIVKVQSLLKAHLSDYTADSSQQKRNYKQIGRSDRIQAQSVPKGKRTLTERRAAGITHIHKHKECLLQHEKEQQENV